MSIRLNSLKPLEQSATGWLYRATSPCYIAPGQSLQVNDQQLLLLDCRAGNSDYQVEFLASPEFDSSVDAVISGQVFNWLPETPVILLAEQVGNSMAIHWLNWLRRQQPRATRMIQLVLMYEPSEFFFRPQPSTILTPQLPASMIAAMPLLDDLGISSRLICDQFQPGCYEGEITEMLTESDLNITDWVGFVSGQTRKRLESLIGKPCRLVETPETG